MQTIRTTFNEVATHREKKGKCAKCGKRTKRRMKFWQTINPFNKNKDGSIKTVRQIDAELAKEADVWTAKPVYCSGCE